MLDSFQRIDNKIMDFIESYLQFPLLDKLMTIITWMGNGGLVWSVLSIFLIYSNDYRMLGYRVIISLILTAIVGEGIIKHLIRRARPFIKIDQGTLLISKPMTYSFPSGHAASSFSVVGVFIIQNSDMSIYIISLAFLIAFSRLYLKVHYTSDVLIGIILGLLCSIVVCSFFNTMSF
ncbi:phosphatase PAP2 family protein [Clostridium sp.]|uniref:phosphatase PAP2 family protein n=1 Tax=Clostridium sp. TaxID=1506 RepID=UPI003D6D32E5